MVTRVGKPDSGNDEDSRWCPEWSLALDAMGASRSSEAHGRSLQPFGDLTELNTSRLILDAVGAELLSDIVSDFRDLLGTSCVVHEKNGDYALGFCDSGWCQLLAASSQRLCGTTDHRHALDSGQWHCHESAWTEASLCSMETGQPVDVGCRGGIRLFAVPIRAGKEFIGSISVGYGDPPRDPKELQELAGIFGVPIDELRAEAEAYVTRPGFVIAWAKKRVLLSARLIGEIVARKQAEQALRESEEQYSAAVQQAKDGMIIIQDGLLRFVNPAMAHLLGYIPADVEHMPFEYFLAPEDRAMVASRIEARLAGEDIPPVYDVRLLHKDGTPIDTQLSISVFQYRGRPASAVILRDITARKRAEAALAESEGRFSQFMEHLPACVFIKDQTGRVLFANRYLKELFGWQQCLGKSTEELLPPNLSDGMTADDRRALAEGPLVIEERVTDIHGTEHYFETCKFPLAAADGPLMLGGIAVEITTRKRTEEALRQSEESYRQLFEQSADGIIITVDGKIVAANRAFCMLHGAPLETVIGLDSLALIHLDDRDFAIQRVRSLLSGACLEGSFVYRSARSGDLPRWVELRSRLIEWAGQTAIQSIVRDISEQKRAEEALREGEARFRQMVEFSPLPIAVVSPTRTIEYLNAKFAETFGYTIDDMPRAADWYYLAYPDAAYRHHIKQEWLRAVERAAATNSAIQRIEAEVVCKDGSLRTMEILSTTVGDKLLALFNDLTERKRAEKVLRETNEVLRTLIQSAPLAIITFDREGKVRLWNPAAERMLGWREEEVLGKFVPHVGIDTMTDHEALRERVLRGETLTDLEVRRHRKDGSPIDMSISAAPLHDAEGNISWIMSVNADISERKRAREERIRLEAQMREVQKFESLGVLAGGIAHDFNNLLMTILGNADLALARLPSASAARHNVTEITRASQRAADLCRQMLAYSGKGRYVVDRCDLSQIVREMAQILEVSISKKVSLHFTLADRLPAVKADTTQMRQVVINLVTNASEALGDRRGVITVSSGVVECDRLCLLENHLDDTLPEGKYVTLEVADTGCGMDTDTLSKVFDPFFSTKFQGRGLGLAAVLGIVRSHKGAIQMRSEPGQGTTVRVLLPALDCVPDELPQDERKGGASLHEGCILLIDDDPNVRRVGAEMLTLLGFRVLTAEDGDEGLGIFRLHQDEIDCIILDLTMPRMGGEETFQELQRVRSDVRVILSSGYHEQELKRQFVGQGLAGFMQKPYTVARLLETLNRVLR